MTTALRAITGNRIIALLTVAACALGNPAARAGQVYTANFDDLSEGAEGPTFSDGGLNFSGLETREPNFPSDYFYIDEATATLSAPFTAPNALAFDGYAIGPSAGFGRFGSCWIDFNGVGSSASLDVFSFAPYGLLDYSQNTLSLEAWNGTTLVATASTSFANQLGIQERSLVLSNIAPFDRVELISSGPVDYGASFILVDNVSVTTVPEPTALLMLPLVALMLQRKRTLSRRSQT